MALDLSFLEGVGFASILWIVIVGLIFIFIKRRKKKIDKKVEGEVEDGLPYLDEMIKG